MVDDINTCRAESERVVSSPKAVSALAFWLKWRPGGPWRVDTVKHCCFKVKIGCCTLHEESTSSVSELCGRVESGSVGAKRHYLKRIYDQQLDNRVEAESSDSGKSPSGSKFATEASKPDS